MNNGIVEVCIPKLWNAINTKMAGKWSKNGCKKITQVIVQKSCILKFCSLMPSHISAIFQP